MSGIRRWSGACRRWGRTAVLAVVRVPLAALPIESAVARSAADTLPVSLTVALSGLLILALLLYWALRLYREVNWRKALQARSQAQAEALDQARSELDQALKRTSGQFQAILDNSPMAIWAKDCDGVYLFANHGFRQMYAGERTVIGERDEAFFSKQHAEMLRANDQIVIRERATRSFVEAVEVQSGKQLKVLTVKFPLFDDRGNVYAAAGTCADISEQMALQEELQRLNQALVAREQQLLRLSRSPMIDAGNLREAWKLLTSAACAGLKVRRASIWFWNDKREAIVCQYLLDEQSGPSEEATVLTRGDYPRYFEALGAGRAILAHDACSDPCTSEFTERYLRPLGITSMLDVAIRHGGDFVGVLCCEHVGAPRRWREEESFFASALADLIGRAMTADSRVRAEGEVKQLLATLEQRVADRTDELMQERAAAEAARFRITDITNSVPGIVFEFIRAADGRYSAPFVNGAVQELVGLTREAVIEDVTRYFALVVSEDIAGYLAAIERSATLGCEVRHSFRMRHAVTGETRWMTVHAPPPRRDHDATCWRGYVIDFTDQKRLESHLEQALQRAQSAERAKSEFLANMSHEIRTPMNAIIGMSHLMLQTQLSAQQLNYARKIDGAASSLLGIVNDILDVSKIEAGKLTLERAQFSLQSLLETLTTMISQRAQEKGLELLFDIDPGIPDALVGDATRLGQILVNLCSNAVKFTETGEIVVAARNVQNDGPKRMIRFEVKDTGIGLRPEQITSLFKPFEQADPSTTRKYGGTGLGLAIARRLCEMMEGEIGVQSEAGRGSTFWFTVRLIEGQPLATAATANLSGLHTLIVDDNPAAREILAGIAQALQLDATVVGSAEEALATLTVAEPPYDLVVADWIMPRMSGVQLTRIIHQKLNLTRMPRVILVTAYGSDELLQDLGDVQCDGLLAKPVSAATLRDAIQEAMGGDRGPAFTKREPVTAGRPDLRGVRILLVEDNDINREVAQEILALTGATIVSVINGEAAVTAATHEHFDAVLMDVQMPVMDGEMATRVLRQNPLLRNLPIIAMTASAMLGDRERFLGCGMNDYVVKPIRVTELYATLLRWVRPPPVAASSGALTDEPLMATALQSIPSLAGIDRAQGLRSVNGDAALYLRLLRKFRDSQQDVVARMRGALQHGEYDAARMLAHTLAGTSGTIGAKALLEAARDVEAACKVHAPIDEVGLESLEALLQTVVTSLAESFDDSADAVDPHVGSTECGQTFELMRQLQQQVHENDTAAVDTLDALGHVFANDVRIERIARHLSRYDFNAACIDVDVLVRDFCGAVTDAPQEASASTDIA